MSQLRAICLVAVVCVLPALRGEEKVDLAVVHKIKTEAFKNSKVMDHLFYLADVNGPRLAGSPGYKAAADWAMKRMQEYGLENVKAEPWGPFGRGWTCSRFSISMVEPTYATLIGVPLAWTPGTDGPISAEPVLAVIREETDFARYKGKLRGKVVLTEPLEPVLPHTTPELRRYTDAELATEATAPDPSPVSPFFAPIPSLIEAQMQRIPPRRFRNREEATGFRNKLNAFLKDEGVRALITPGDRGDDGTVFASSGGSRDPKDPLPPPVIALATEHYNRIVRLLEHKVPVRIAIDYEAKMIDQPDVFNVVAEIPGGSKKDEIVMIGAHLDSWQAGTGATDNGCGSAVVMEAMRVLKSLHLKMDRTVRLALWDGEEEGLLGSKAYVTQHFADPETMEPKPEHAKLAAYFNLDNGSGKIRGIFMQSNDMVRPIFAAWLAPFQDLGAATLSIRNTGSTDHVSFDAVGLPGFQFIQDPLDYGSLTHHSNMDLLDHAAPSDLMQASAIMAWFAYNAAVRDEMLPRKELPAGKKAR
jgi:hypothetical protein